MDFHDGLYKKICHRTETSVRHCLTLSQIFYSSKLREFADDNFKFDENGRNFPEWVENTVGKGEIAGYEQFLPFPQCFQKSCKTDT